MDTLFMGRQCTICTHPNRSDINQLLLERQVPYRIIAEQYGVSIAAIKRHVRNHLKPKIQKIQAEADAETEQQIVDTMTLYNNLIAEKWAELKDTASFKDLLRIVEHRSRIMGEDKTTVVVPFAWGKGTNINDEKETKLDKDREEEIESAKIRESNR
jgi:hypothetical protein